MTQPMNESLGHAEENLLHAARVSVEVIWTIESREELRRCPEEIRGAEPGLEVTHTGRKMEVRLGQCERAEA